MHRRWLVPELVQTSGMDCGPAAITALLEGFGIHASYPRIREACQTEVDGTSIDTLEEVMVRLGLDAEQQIIPVDHLLMEDQAVPGLVVVVLPNGFTHFVVIWRTHGPFVQVMDPATGRRWMTRAAFLRDVFVHKMTVPADEFEAWAKTDGFVRPLVARLEALGVQGAEVKVKSAVEQSGQAIAGLDAATRMTARLVEAGGVRRGAEAAALCLALEARAKADPTAIPDRYWYARAAEGPGQVVVAGAVAVVVRGPRASPAPDAEDEEPLPRELIAALDEAPFRPWAALGGIVWKASGLRASTVAAMMVLASVTTLFEALVLRGLVDLGSFVHLREQRMAAIFAVVALFVAALGLEWKLLDLVQRIGRSLETELRIAFLSKAPRLGMRYFRSRPASDLAGRIHETHRVRALPETISEAVRDGLGILAILVGVAWVDPNSLLPAACIAAVSLALPLLFQPIVSERELRMRTHAGAMLFSVTDALLGMMPLRAHVGERALRREHEQILSEWLRCGYRLLRIAVLSEALVGLVRVAGLAWLLASFLARPADQRAMLLVTYWVLYMGSLGRRLVGAVRQLAPLRNITFRVLEPLGAPEDAAVAVSASPEALAQSEPEPGKGMTIELDDVSLHAGGHTVLEGIDLRIEAGEHVAIVGVSGGGKTSLVSMVLGLYRPSSGVVRVDGVEVSAENRDRRAAATVWVDPAVQLWNRSLVDNLLYGARTSEGVGAALEAADLLEVAERLPDGMHTALGEGGRLLSGGQGQRVRLGRAMMRPSVRLVVLDEAFRGLEVDRRRTLLARARARWADATLLSVTHDVHDTVALPRVLVVEEGRIVEDGAPTELLARSGSRYRLLFGADASAQKRIWGVDRWRTIRVDQGAVDGSGSP